MPRQLFHLAINDIEKNDSRIVGAGPDITSQIHDAVRQQFGIPAERQTIVAEGGGYWVSWTRFFFTKQKIFLTPVN